MPPAATGMVEWFPLRLLRVNCMLPACFTVFSSCFRMDISSMPHLFPPEINTKLVCLQQEQQLRELQLRGSLPQQQQQTVCM